MEKNQEFFGKKELELQKEITDRLKKIENPSERLEYLCGIKLEFQTLSNLIANFEKIPNEEKIESYFESIRIKLLK